MCGILGSINKHFDEKVLRTIKHRGPDADGIKRYSDYGKEITLGHVRLSIVDLSETGSQPMVSQCGNYCIIFNGEIYNHLDLRKEIKFDNFRGHSDTETLLYYLIEKGIDGLKEINGIFAFAFYDRAKGTILLARDRFGVKPLYYSSTDNSLVFSSETRAIRKIIDTDINQDTLPVLLNFRYIPAPFTLFKGINKLRPGHYMEVELKGVRLETKGESFVGREVPIMPPPASFKEATIEYGKLFENAVRRQLMSDVEVGVLLSGGIDSALVAASAVKYSLSEITGFTVGFDSKYNVNEIEWAAESAKTLGMRHEYVKMDTNDFFDVFEECVNIVEEPLADISYIPMYYLCRLASQNVKVVLSGQGADEPLGGYGRYQGEILRDKYPHFLFPLMKQVLKLIGSRNEQLIRGARTLAENDDIERLLGVYNVFQKQNVYKLTGKEDKESEMLVRYFYDLLECKKQKTSVERMMSIDMRMDLSDDLLLYSDKLSMNFSLECRVPLLDNELVKFIEALPAYYRVKRGQTKIIHKAYAKSVLPDYIINRKKLAFQSPTEIWFREKFDSIQDFILGPNSLLLDYLDKQEIAKILNDYKNGYERDRQVFLLLSLNYWLKGIKNNILLTE